MEKGIIYVMTTVVPGLIKIGKAGTDNFEKRMYNLEHNGYSNVVGLKRHFAIEVDDYSEKETLLHDIFSKSRVENTELFALDENLVVQLLSSFEGKQVFPQNLTKEQVFDDATNKRDISVIPEGKYYLNRKIKRWNNQEVKGTIKVEDGKITVLKGSVVCPVVAPGTHDEEISNLRRGVPIADNALLVDCPIDSLSAAGALLIGGACNGWAYWKTQEGNSIDIFRKS